MRNLHIHLFFFKLTDVLTVRKKKKQRWFFEFFALVVWLTVKPTTTYNNACADISYSCTVFFSSAFSFLVAQLSLVNMTWNKYIYIYIRIIANIIATNTTSASTNICKTICSVSVVVVLVVGLTHTRTC